VGSFKLPPAPPSHGGTFSSYASGHNDQEQGDDLPTLHL
jgi:hypothetical protein